MRRLLKTDYLVVGAGASGMAFADSLITSSDADVVMVDRRHAPGGHWNDTYPFIRLHQPSAYYAVNSMPLGTDMIDTQGVNAGMYEQASGNEICAYYERVMRQQLLASGRVRYFPQCDYTGHGEFVSLLTGDQYEVSVRNAVVDATYLEPSIPATSAPPFEVGDGVQCVPVNELARIPEPPDGYVIIGSGKTGADAVLHLLENGVPPALIRWIKPREAWYLNRTFTQGGELLSTLFDGLAQQMEACAQSASAAELFDRLDQSRQMLRVDEHVTPTMFRGRLSAQPKSNCCDRSTERSDLGECAESRPARSTSMAAPSQPPQEPCTCMPRQVASIQRPRHPFSVLVRSDCSRCASVLRRSTRRSSDISRRPDPTSPARTACALRTLNPTPRPTGSAAL